MDLSKITSLSQCDTAIQQREQFLNSGTAPAFMIDTIKTEIEELKTLRARLSGPISIYNYLSKKIGYSNALITCIDDTYNHLTNQPGFDTSIPGLLLGRIQSGKTRAFVGVMAKAFDNGFDACIVLTKPDDGLVMQTKARMEQDFEDFLDDTNIYPQNVVRVYDVKKKINLSALEVSYKNIFVLHKNQRLKAMKDTLDTCFVGKKVLVIDDEADFVSRTFYTKKKVVSGGITGFRIDDLTNNPDIDCYYLQVTGTPYSLLLQPNETIEVDNGIMSCFHPRFTVLVPTHDRYVGGEHYFVKSLDMTSMCSLLTHTISDTCLDRFLVKNKDGRITKKAGTHPDFKDLRESLMYYFVGSAIRRIQESRNHVNYKTSFLIHCATEKGDHSYEKNIVDIILNVWHKDILQGQTKGLYNSFLTVYNSLSESNRRGNSHVDPNTGKHDELHNLPMPSEADVWDEFKNIFHNTLYTVKCINGDTTDDPNLYQSDGQLKLPAHLNIFIGGYKADRGITINNMIGFLYGRRPQNGGAANTILQHMRHYGNRSAEDLSVTRMHTTNALFQKLSDIHATDESLRDSFKNNATPSVSYVEYDPQSATYKLCSPQQIKLSSINCYGSFARIIATPGFQTKTNNEIGSTIGKIDTDLRTRGNEMTPFLMDKDDVIRILTDLKTTFQYSQRLGNKDFEWDEKTMIAAIEKHVPTDNKIWVYYNHKSQGIQRLRSNGRFVDAPEDGNNDTAAARRYAQDRPFLMLIHEPGEKSQGWNDAPFFWPVLRLPHNASYSVFCDGSMNATRNVLTLRVVDCHGNQVNATGPMQTLIECIKLADPAKVQALNIKYRKNNLVYTAGKCPKDYEVIIPRSYYLRKGITSQQAEVLLKQISSSLNLGWDVSLK